MNASNYLAVLDMMLSLTEYSMRLGAMLRDAEREGRDITQEEIASLRESNIAKIDELLSDENAAPR